MQRDYRRKVAAAKRARRAAPAPAQEDDFEITYDADLNQLAGARAPVFKALYAPIAPTPTVVASPPGVSLRRVLFIPDTHVPYEDSRAFELMLAVARAWRPDEIVVLGDFADFYAVSAHDKRPDRVRLLDVEVAAVCERRAQLDALGATTKRFILGNHEDRLERYLMVKAPELFNLVRVVDLFKLKENDWKVTPYKQHTQTGKIFLTHDCGNAGAQAHVKAVHSFQHNTVLGHTHRCAVHYERNAHGESHVGAMFGWLGDVEKVDYLHRIQAMAWQLGFGIGYQEASGVTHLQAVPIVDYRCVVEGRLYVG